jgi:hypothetical protein
MVTIVENDWEIAKSRLATVKKYFKIFPECEVELNRYWKDHILVSVPTGNILFGKRWCPVLIYSGYINCRDEKYLSVCKKIAKKFKINTIFK